MPILSDAEKVGVALDLHRRTAKTVIFAPVAVGENANGVPSYSESSLREFLGGQWHLLAPFHDAVCVHDSLRRGDQIIRIILS